MLPPELANGNGQPPAPEAESVGPGLDELVDELGNAVKVNAEMSAGAERGDESQKFMRAALEGVQAIVALIPYADPTAEGDKQTDNPAKKAD